MCLQKLADGEEKDLLKISIQHMITRATYRSRTPNISPSMVTNRFRSPCNSPYNTPSPSDAIDSKRFTKSYFVFISCLFSFLTLTFVTWVKDIYYQKMLYFLLLFSHAQDDIIYCVLIQLLFSCFRKYI